MALQDGGVLTYRTPEHAARTRQQERGDHQASHPEDREAVIQRRAVIDHHEGGAAWPKDSCELSDGSLRLARMVDDAVRIDQVERVSGKRQVRRACLRERSGQSVLSESPLCELDGDR